MQLDWTELTPLEHERPRAGECLYCGHLGHFPRCLSSLPKRLSSSVAVGVLVSKTNAPLYSLPRMIIPATFCLSLPLQAFDSGAEQCYLDSNLVSQAGSAIIPLPVSMKVSALNGNLLACHTLNHCEYIQCYVISSPQTPH